MNYIYDILVNFNEELFDFYEWNYEDDVDHIRKMPLLKVSTDMMYDILFHHIMIDQTILDKIKNKTELFCNRNVKTMKYAGIFTDGEEVVVLKFDNQGYTTHYSKLIVDEEMEVIEVSDHMETQEITYEKVSDNHYCYDKTRNELQIKQYIEQELNKLKNCNQIEKLRYLYFECFDEQEQDKTKIMKRILNELKDNFDDISNKLYHFFKMTSYNK